MFLDADFVSGGGGGGTVAELAAAAPGPCVAARAVPDVAGSVFMFGSFEGCFFFSGIVPRKVAWPIAFCIYGRVSNAVAKCSEAARYALSALADTSEACGARVICPLAWTGAGPALLCWGT